MKAIYSFAMALLTYSSFYGQTTVYSQDFVTYPQNWNFGYTYSPTVGNGAEYPDQYNIYLIQRPFLSDQTSNNPSISVEMYSADLSCWAISPTFDLSAGGYNVSFDYAAGASIYSVTPSGQASQTPCDDVFKFLISQDNGVTWQELESIPSPNIGIPNTRTTKTYALTGYNSATTKFAFYTSNGSDPDWGVDYTLYFDDFKITSNSALSTSEQLKEIKNFSLYPNPTTGYSYIKSDKKVESIEVYDLSGKLISKGKEINLSFVLNGSYLARIIFSDGTFATEKVIKK